MAHLLIRNTVLPDRRLPLPGKVVVLGRSLDSDVPILHPSVSRRHALLETTEGEFLISDLGSSNGTFVGDRRLEAGEREVLPLGTRFRLGKVDVVLTPDEALLDNAPPAGVAASAAVARPAGRPSHASGSARAAAPSGPAPGSIARRPPPSIAKRVALRKKRKDALRWVGIAITVVLLVLAGLFIKKIADRSNGESVPVAAPEGEPEKPDPADGELSTLRIQDDGE